MDEDDGPAMVEAPSHVLSLYEQAGAPAKAIDSPDSAAAPNGESAPSNSSMAATADEAQTVGIEFIHCERTKPYLPIL